MSGRKEFVEALELAKVNLDTFKARHNTTQEKIDLDLYENLVREYYLRSAALRLYEIYNQESDKHVGQWDNGDYFIYYKCASFLSELARLGEIFYDIQNKGLTNDKDYV
jgi:hypothetical protein